MSNVYNTIYRQAYRELRKDIEITQNATEFLAKEFWASEQKRQYTRQEITNIKDEDQRLAELILEVDDKQKDLFLLANALTDYVKTLHQRLHKNKVLNKRDIKSLIRSFSKLSIKETLASEYDV